MDYKWLFLKYKKIIIKKGLFYEKKKILKIIILFIFTTLCLEAENKDLPTVKNGFLDLSDWDFSKNGIVYLNGEWDFVSGEFISPQDYINSSITKQKQQYLPGMWGEPFDSNGKMSWQGYYTFHIKVKIKNPDGILFFKIGQFSTACNVWIDNTLLIKNGKISKNKKQSKASFRPMKNAFNPRSTVFHITIHCSNYQDRYGSRSVNVILGNEQDIDRYIMLHRGLEFAAAIILLLSIFWFLVFFIFSRNQRILIFIGLCAAALIKILCSNEGIILFLIPDIPAFLMYRFIYGSYYLAVLFFVMFCADIFKKYFPDIIKYIFFIICSIFILVTIVTNTNIASFIMVFFHFVTICTIGFSFYAAIRSIQIMKWRALYFLIGFIIFFGILFYIFWMINGGHQGIDFIEHYALVFFVLFHVPFIFFESPEKTIIGKDNYEIFNTLKLTDREKEVALLLVKGLTNVQIADKLFISLSTAKFHIRNIFQKSGVNNRNSFAHLYFKMQIDKRKSLN